MKQITPRELRRKRHKDQSRGAQVGWLHATRAKECRCCTLTDKSRMLRTPGAVGRGNSWPIRR